MFVDGDGLAIIVIIVWVVGVFCGVFFKNAYEKDNASQNKTIKITVDNNIIEAISTGEKKCDLLKYRDDIQIGDEIVYSDGNGFTQHRIVKHILRHTENNGLKKGYCIICF